MRRIEAKLLERPLEHGERKPRPFVELWQLAKNQAGREPVEHWGRAFQRTNNTRSTREVLVSGFRGNPDTRKRTGTDPRALSPWPMRDNEDT